MKKLILKHLFLSTVFVCCTFSAYAYDPCDIEFSVNSLAESECFNITRPLETSLNEDTEFNLRSVLLTKSLSDKLNKETMVLIPGGPGSDSQALKESLNSKEILNAFWAHLNLNVVMYDPRGTGSSVFKNSAEFYEQSVFSTRNQVADLDALLEVISPDKPVYLLAHSAGGNTAAKYAATYPLRVKGLIMYSASMSTREIGESNLRIFSDKFQYWKNYLRENKNEDEAKSLEARRLFIESFLKNVLKLQRILNERPHVLQSGFYLKNFRLDLIKAVENENRSNRLISDVLSKWSLRIENLDEEVFNLVNDQESILFTLNNNIPPILRRGTWIKTAVICSEGLTEDEFENKLWLEGLAFKDDTCDKTTPLYSEMPSLGWVKSILAPTVFIGGSHDPLQVLSSVKKNAFSISHSKLVVFEGAGHEAHLNDPFRFYKEVESFLLETSGLN